MGLMTVIGFARRGYFIPYRYAADLPTPGTNSPYAALEQKFDRYRPEISSLIGEIDTLAPRLEAIHGGPGQQPRWDQGWFPRLDAAAAYAMVNHLRPARIIEVGSGHSTRFMVRAIRDGGLETRFTSIDPAPRATTDALNIDHIQCKAHEADPAVFATLQPGDILFIDSSHILMPGTDVDFILNRIWPQLAAGVVIHFHDIFLPDDYPPAWTWRGYNEQLGVAPLISGDAVDILFASHYAVSRMSEQIAGTVIERLPLVDGAVESSLWLRKRAPMHSADPK
jgi:hypothetical protein